MKYRIYFLFLATVLFGTMYANVKLIKAVKQLDIYKIECELKKGKTITQTQKNVLLQELHEIMEDSKQKQLSWEKYLNRNTLAGTASLLLCIVSGVAFIKAKRKNINRIDDLCKSQNGDSPRSWNGSVSGARINGWKTGYKEGFLKGLKTGIAVGCFSTGFGLLAVHQFYKSFTDYDLKENFKSTLAVKQLIETVPVS